MVPIPALSRPTPYNPHVNAGPHTMTTPDIDYDKALGVVAPRFKLLEKTEQDDVWAALPGQFQMVLTQLKHCNMFEWGLVCMTKAYIDMQEEAGKKWSHRAPRDEAHDWIKVAKKLLDMHNLAQTVASTVEAVASTALTVDAHGVRLDGLDENFAEQKTINEGGQQDLSFNAHEHIALKGRVKDQRRAMDKVKHFVEGAIGQQSRMAETLDNKFMTEEKERKELHCLTVKKAEAAAGAQKEVNMLAQLNDDNCKRLAA